MGERCGPAACFLAQWYLARAEFRAGRREAALRAYAKLRENRAGIPALAEGLFEFAQLEMEAHRFDEALAILKEAHALGPSPAWRERIVLLTARAYFYAKRFDKAGETFEQVATSSSRLRREALFNAALAWLQQNDHTRFLLVDAKDLGGNSANDETRGDLLLEEGLTQAAQAMTRRSKPWTRFFANFSSQASGGSLGSPG